MRDITFKNLTSQDKRRRIIASSETISRHGMRSIVHKHFIYMIKEADSMEPAVPQVYLTKEHNTREKREKVLCKVKGSVNVVDKGVKYCIIFMHSLRIDLMMV